MKFHHIGIATKDLKSSLEFVQKNFEVLEVSEEIFDENQNATLQMIKTKDYRVVLTLRKVEGNEVKSVNQEKLLNLFPSGASIS